MRGIIQIVFLTLLLSGCSRPERPTHHHFVSMGIKDLPLILLDQDTGKICYAGDSPATSEYLTWYEANVGQIGVGHPLFFCSDVAVETK